MPTKIAINGLWPHRPYVLSYRASSSGSRTGSHNDLTDAQTLAHLMKHDSIHGALKYEVMLFVAGREIQVLSEHDPAKLPWQRLGVELVIESSGKFRSCERASLHLAVGARKVLISAPADNADVIICMGVNQEAYDPRRHDIVSNASCTTNCLAPIAKVLDENFEIAFGLMTTVHAYTTDQMLQDGPDTDLRRARAIALSMVPPTSTGPAKAIGRVPPSLKGKLGGIAVRVPNVSLVDLAASFERDVDEAAVNSAVEHTAWGELKGILAYCEEPLVSTDFNGNPHSSNLRCSAYQGLGASNGQGLRVGRDSEWAMRPGG